MKTEMVAATETMPVCFMPHMHLLVWKLQNGAKSLVKLGP